MKKLKEVDRNMNEYLLKLISLLAVYPTVGFLLITSFIFLRASLPFHGNDPPGVFILIKESVEPVFQLKVKSNLFNLVSSKNTSFSQIKVS